jgi:hypothetical protein
MTPLSAAKARDHFGAPSASAKLKTGADIPYMTLAASIALALPALGALAILLAALAGLLAFRFRGIDVQAVSLAWRDRPFDGSPLTITPDVPRPMPSTTATPVAMEGGAIRESGRHLCKATGPRGREDGDITAPPLCDRVSKASSEVFRTARKTEMWTVGDDERGHSHPPVRRGASDRRRRGPRTRWHTTRNLAIGFGCRISTAPLRRRQVTPDQQMLEQFAKTILIGKPLDRKRTDAGVANNLGADCPTYIQNRLT